jgi:4-amino-4-deoxy-L-arabinose transferase-like glycosyltransferase
MLIPVIARGLPPAATRLVVPTLLVAILAFGFGVRIPNLAGPSLNIDEVLHVFAAEQLLEGNPPTLPSGLRYARGLLYTESVALVGRFRGVDEWSARLPSVVFGCLTIVLVFVMTRRWYSSGAALVAALITAAAPMQVAFSREARMYAMFQFAYLLFVFLFFQALETSPARRWRARLPERLWQSIAALKVHPVLFVGAAVALLASRHLHDLTLAAASGPAAYVFGMALLAWLAGAAIGLRPAKYVAVTALILAGAVPYAIDNDLGDVFTSSLTYVPAWAIDNTSRLYYLRVLAAFFPAMLETLLLAAGFALVRNAKVTIYLLLCFGVPFVAHSALFAAKHDRYIFHLVPLMFIVFSAGFWDAVSRLYEALRDWARQATTLPVARLAAGTLAAVAAVAFLLLVPWVRGGLSVHERNEGSFAGVYHEEWRSAARYVSEHLATGDVVIASAPALAKYYGIEAPLLYLANDSTDQHVEQGLRNADGDLVDYIGGAPLILDPETLRNVLSQHASGWMVSERFRFDGGRPLPAELRDLIAARAERVDLPAARSMVIWRWRSDGDDR